ncbi:hypothetical protein N7460_002385 [Penicillium canescens]|uniref:Amidase domain-containing protein n=1 Tax=Penicillium canescens TaxID=5083 RepID=A0AAD6NCP0_PENCN|nr:hypothetical protein N7460_002385 [Penicillium canescens]
MTVVPQQKLSWQESARQVQAVRDRSIEQADPAIAALPDTHTGRVIDFPRKHLSQTEIAITESSAETLVASLATGKLTAITVTNAFLRRAAIAHKLTNCIYELLPDRAIARAKELDDYVAKHGKPCGPLHGLPISIKGHVGLKGRDLSAGFVSWLNQESPDDSNIVNILLDAGAVVYARTTEPQGLMALETCSNITGTTTNPHNTALTPGGSSGGESALQALYGSPLGIGSDIGGSIRSPAANCGLYGLKPSTGRLPLIGCAAYVLGCETIMGTLGPISPTLGGVELFMKTIIESKPWVKDSMMLPIPWRDHEKHIHLDNKKLTVGVMWTDDVVTPAPAVTRALKEVVERLKLVDSIEVIEWKAYQQKEALEILTRLYAPDGGKAFARHVEASGEPFTPLTSWTLRDAPGIEELSQQGVWDWTGKREMFRYAYLQEWNNVAPEMDVILCPAFPTPAPFTTLRALVFPVTKVDPERDAKDTTYTPKNEFDSWAYEHYDPVKQKDAPVSLQLVAKRLEEEKLLQAFREIQEKVGLPFVNCLA